MTADLVIKDAIVVTPFGMFSGGIAIEDSKIAAVAKESNLPKADKTLDAKGKVVIPGLVDPHVHLASKATRGGFDEYMSAFEDECRTNSASAVSSGVTTYGHYLRPDVGPIAKVIEAIPRNCMIDVFCHAIILEHKQLDEIPTIAKSGVTSYKFMFNAYKGPDGAFSGLKGIEGDTLFGAFVNVGELSDQGYVGTAVMIHAENQDMIYGIREKFKREGRTDLAVWTDSRPDISEEERMLSAFYIAKSVKIIREPPMLYVPHMSIGKGVDIVEMAKKDGINMVAETCPHYLLLTKNDSKLGPLAKVAPPLREKEDCEKLWWGLRHGLVETIGSDHIASMPLSRKPNDIWKAVPGFPGDGMLQLMLSEGVKKGRITLEKLVEVCCVNPAKLFGLFPRKGAILPGSDADLVIVDLNKVDKLTLEKIHSPAEFSVYDGWELKGWPILTMVRGHTVMENGEIVGKLGTGQYLPRVTK